MSKDFNTYVYQRVIKEAYEGRNRSTAEATGMLACEAAELQELFLKDIWYNKPFTQQQLLSECGDILNFLTFILQERGFTLHDAMDDNTKKLKDRGWIK